MGIRHKERTRQQNSGSERDNVISREVVMKRKSFTIYNDYRKQFELLSGDQVKELMLDIFDYNDSREMKEIKDPMVKMAFSFIKPNLDKEYRKSRKQCLTKSVKFIPPPLSDWQDYFIEYANKKYSKEFPVSIIKCNSLSENSYHYWFDNDCKEWNKAKRKDWRKTIENKVRRENVKLKDWEISVKKEVKRYG